MKIHKNHVRRISEYSAYDNKNKLGTFKYLHDRNSSVLLDP